MNTGLERIRADSLLSPALAILCGGMLAGALDITYAITVSGFRGVPAMAVLQSVAAGVLD